MQPYASQKSHLSQQWAENVKDRFNQAMHAKLATKDAVSGESIGKIMHTKMFQQPMRVIDAHGNEEEKICTQIRCYFALINNSSSSTGSLEQERANWRDFLRQALPNDEVAEEPEPTFI